MIKRPILNPYFQAEIVDARSVILLSETDSFLLGGALYVLLVPLIDGHRTTDDLVTALDGTASIAEIYYALMRMEQKGYILEAEYGLPATTAAFWSGLGANPAEVERKVEGATVGVHAVGDVPAGPLVHALAQLGLGSGQEAGVDVVLTDDYLRTALGLFNQAAVQSGRPWLLVKPVGTVLWVGPLFVPGETGCWACLAHRLSANREVERFVVRRKGLEEPVVLATGSLPTASTVAVNLASTEIARWLATGTSALKGTVSTLHLQSWQLESHRLVRRPQCPVCGNPAPSEPQPVEIQSCVKQAGDRSTSPEQTLAQHGHHVSPVTGIVRSLSRTTPAGDGVMHNYAAGHNVAVQSSSVYRLRQHLRSLSGGKGATDVQARVSGLCEALERQSGLFEGNEPRLRSTLKELGDRAIHPNAAMNFSEEQYRNRVQWNAKRHHFHLVPDPFDGEQEVDWSPIWSLTKQSWRYLPTRFLYYGVPGETGVHLLGADSNGNAAGATREEAIYQGLMELIERDSVAIWWYNRIRRPAVDLASFGDTYIDRLAQRYREMGREVWVLDLTADLGVPAFAAVSRRVGVQPEGIMVGFGAHLDAKVAAIRALTELNQFLPTVSALVDGKAEDSDSDLVHWWRTATLENQPYLVPLEGLARRASDFPQVHHEDVADDIRFVQRILEAKGMELLVLDQTRPDIGLPVVKVVVPGLRHFWARFGPGRLYDVPVQLGWLSSPTPESDLNPIPLFV